MVKLSFCVYITSLETSAMAHYDERSWPSKANEEVCMVDASHQKANTGFHCLWDIFQKRKLRLRTFGWFPTSEEARSLHPTTASTKPRPRRAPPVVFFPGVETHWWRWRKWKYHQVKVKLKIPPSESESENTTKGFGKTPIISAVHLPLHQWDSVISSIGSN